jgi:alkylation response protein AidB-like acyl-CoA dehydrogenase
MSKVKGLFIGDTPSVFPYPKPLSKDGETLKLVLESIDRFLEGKKEELSAYDRNSTQPDDYIQALRDLGLFGVIIPEEYGGIGLSNAGYSRVLQQIARHDGSTSLTVGAHSSIGMKGLLLFGTDAQKAKYLPKLATGEFIAAFCLTEPGSGSDAASIKTEAKKQPDGRWILNGEKIWITNGPLAQFFTVFARTNSDGGQLSCFIVERSQNGVSVGPKEAKMGIRASATSTVAFSDVVLEPDALLGEEGKGFKIAMEILNNGRTGLGGGCVGAMKRAISLARDHANNRKQFGRSIGEFALIKEKIALMTAAAFATESVVGIVGDLIDSGEEDYSLEAAISKIYASESLWFVGNEALQIAGGTGFMSEYPFERIVRDSRINLIFEGTNEILRLYIALSGFKFAGDYLKGIGKGVSSFFKDPIKGFGVLYDYTQKKISEVTPIGRENFDFLPIPLQEYGGILGALTAQLAGQVEKIVRIHGNGVIGQQLISKRVADSAIAIFVGFATVSRVASLLEEKGEEASSLELMIAEIVTKTSKRIVSDRLRGLRANEDSSILTLGEHILRDGYNWDLF